jgi:hypothetical protein
VGRVAERLGGRKGGRSNTAEFEPQTRQDSGALTIFSLAAKRGTNRLMCWLVHGPVRMKWTSPARTHEAGDKGQKLCYNCFYAGVPMDWMRISFWVLD